MRTTTIIAVLITAALTTGACASSDRPAPGQDTAHLPPAPEPAVDKPLQTLGSNLELGPMSVLNVYVMPPPEGHYQAGQDAVVRLTLVNNSRTDDALTAVSSPLARTAAIHWDRGCDGTAEQVDRLPVTARGLVPAPADALEYRHSPYHLELRDLTKDVLGMTLPITVTFAQAGTATVQAKIRPQGEPHERYADLACTREKP
ncbi:copper chaperone PCu(A)C [Amycolatopsis keratiniphila]|uniref:copper chaperone PCu(A)C n=1 Tax=Amycolatopsis keratiniphila TaxID=129921 RepID=UPI0008792154|nr:copper chaperone PCu(A)C [Amycolatopsis keratiniphila]OLZ47159.1 hypothetical protein BS330_35460 [Amycolatopsis keratiniphila subsp. nogabecina]SDU00298.1 Copper(I)-binding protein [Amycolatopsis keratiniphila]